jgi:hypothetical protein
LQKPISGVVAAAADEDTPDRKIDALGQSRGRDQIAQTAGAEPILDFYENIVGQSRVVIRDPAAKHFDQGMRVRQAERREAHERCCFIGVGQNSRELFREAPRLVLSWLHDEHWAVSAEVSDNGNRHLVEGGAVARIPLPTLWPQHLYEVADWLGCCEAMNRARTRADCPEATILAPLARGTATFSLVRDRNWR